MKKILGLILGLLLLNGVGWAIPPAPVVLPTTDGVTHTLGSTSVGKNLTVNATLGAELITAPMVTEGWTLGSDGGGAWTITTGVMYKTASTGTLTAAAGSGQTTAPVAGTTYKVVIVTSAINGTVIYTMGGVSGTSITTATTTTDYITATSTDKIVLSGVAATTCTITSISVRALTDGTGDVTVDGNLIVRSPAELKAVVPAGGEIGTITNSVVAGNPSVWFKIRIGDSYYAVPGWLIPP